MFVGFVVQCVRMCLGEMRVAVVGEQLKGKAK